MCWGDVNLLALREWVISGAQGLPAPSSPTGFDTEASSPSHNLLPSYQWGSAEESRGQAGGASSCPRLDRVLCRG